MKQLLIAVVLVLTLAGCSTLGDEVNEVADENERICEQAPQTEHCDDPSYNLNGWDDYKEK